MPRRKPRFPDKPHIMAEDIRKKFQALIDKGKEKLSQLPEPKWALWNRNTLEDVPQD